MRPLRFLLTLCTFVIAFLLLVYSGPWRRASTRQDFEPPGRIRTFLNWRTPSSLFPPSAIISLTDDNSTFFLARPAAFGPLLPIRSLSGELWIGGGFGSAGAEGEVGCSDVPGWDGGRQRTAQLSGGRRVPLGGSAETESQEKANSRKRRHVDADETVYTPEGEAWPSEDDGTDDHLHHPLPPSDGTKTPGNAAAFHKKPVHADIQSLQESAEIAGKIVLLSRGGCGFLEKVKWVQRRGGVALIVGDDVRGAQLVTMYARGDTSNVTIPSLFTSHTTAHLLSSLFPSGRLVDGSSLDQAARMGLALGSDAGSARVPAQKSVAVAERPDFTTSEVATKATNAPTSLDRHGRKYLASENDESQYRERIQRIGWLGRLFRASSTTADERTRRVGWIQEEFEAEWNNAYYTTTLASRVASPTQKAAGKDGFVIGVQDWRDPDLVAEPKEQLPASTASSSSALPHNSKAAFKKNAFNGGSITPGSGEYIKAYHDSLESSKSGDSSNVESSRYKSESKRPSGPGRWFGLFHSHRTNEKEHPVSVGTNSESHGSSTPRPLQAQPSKPEVISPEGIPLHEGLWITLTPTSMSASPLLDTLLVLVVSPLVTLTVVYALLLLRSRVRRRRWRAPKSVVERLPVRTYQTMPSSANTSTTNSSISSPVSATTPLLPSANRPITTRPRPRSRTVAGMPQAGSSLQSDDMASPSLEQIEEKRAAGLAEWRRRYGGKQRECVVCLDEYVDGVSRVMSLPCGHEFHAECITPWLTTRRRTCPICKGDVVRSLARSGVASSAHSSPPLHEANEEDGNDDGEDELDFHPSSNLPPPLPTSEDVQEQAVLARNDDPTAARPVSREDTNAFDDLERGLVLDRTR